MELHLTSIERRLFDCLGDGEPHDPKELIPLLEDELADKTHLQDHLRGLRNKIRILGEDILAQSFGRRIAYRRIILITTVNVASNSASTSNP